MNRTIIKSATFSVDGCEDNYRLILMSDGKAEALRHADGNWKCGGEYPDGEEQFEKLKAAVTDGKATIIED